MFQITREDIDGGGLGAKNCAAARCLQRALGMRSQWNVTVGIDQVRFFSDTDPVKTHRIDSPQNLIDFINAYDETGKETRAAVKPIAFELPVSELAALGIKFI